MQLSRSWGGERGGAASFDLVVSSGFSRCDPSPPQLMSLQGFSKRKSVYRKPLTEILPSGDRRPVSLCAGDDVVPAADMRHLEERLHLP